ncbi:replication protein, partial [Escherichia coli]|nr:replication protein [Escherichia coli]EFN7597182.1 replication protein [Escherichia coli]EFO0647068.1 replication protein [Escherichia coli]
TYYLKDKKTKTKENKINCQGKTQ